MNRKIRIALLVQIIPVVIYAQVVPLQTAPFIGAQQLIFQPSRNLGAAGISIAAEDPAGDPFVNPACGTGMNGLKVFSSPTLVAPGQKASAILFSVGAQYGDESIYGGIVAARQQTNENQYVTYVPTYHGSGGRNEFVHALMGYHFPESGTSVGASAMTASIGHLVALGLGVVTTQGSDRGFVEELKIGIEHRFAERSRFDAVIVRNITSISYGTVTYGSPTPYNWFGPANTGNDQSITWALQTHFVQPLSETIYLGLIVSGNWKQLTELVNFQPGEARAFQFGLGIARVGKQSLLGFEATYVPAVVNLVRPLPIPVPWATDGMQQASSDVRFSNWVGKAGARFIGSPMTLSFGVQLHAVRYDLHESGAYGDIETYRKEGWNEWSISFGVGVKLWSVDVDYAGLLTTFNAIPRDAIPACASSENYSIDIFQPFSLGLGTGVSSVFHRVTLAVQVF